MMKQLSFTHGGPRVHNAHHVIEMPSEDLYRLASVSSSDSRVTGHGVTRASFKQRIMEKTTALKNFTRSLGCMWSPTDDFEPKREAKVRVLDPRSPKYQLWNKVFMVTCLVAVFVDPLFFYVPVVNLDNLCFDIDRNLAIIVTVLRTVIDSVYLVHILLQFRTGFLSPSSYQLVEDTKKIARRYIRGQFWLDLVVILPLPQVVMLVFLPVLRASKVPCMKAVVLCLIVFHYVPRLLRMFFIVKITETVWSQKTEVFMETVWVAAAYNLLLYMMASHVFGACWYLLTVERQVTCWRKFCHDETSGNCSSGYFNCRTVEDEVLGSPRAIWLERTNIAAQCVANSSDPTSTPFNFGLYSLAMENNITATTHFVNKFFYCLWFGLNSLTSLGLGFQVSTYIWEVLFAIIVFISGGLLFGLLIGNVQKFLSSLGMRLDEVRVKRMDDIEEWMNHRKLPSELRNRVRRYDQYKWVKTQGVDEPALLQNLPLDLRRDIKRHLCLNFVRRVPLFDQMDDRLLDAICERLQPALHTEYSFLVQEGDTVVEMVFIIRGQLESITTNGGRTFPNRYRLGPGDFCGEEILSWALTVHEKTLPSSTRTVQATTDVEAFFLSAKDLKFVASQVSKLYSKKLEHKIRYYSHKWRTWAATFVQASWRRYRHRRFDNSERELQAYAFMQAQETVPKTVRRRSSIIS